MRVMLCAVVPALTAIALGLLLDSIGDLTWGQYGYWLASDHAVELSLALIGAGLVVLAVGLLMAFRSYRRAHNLVAAAPELHDPLGSHPEGLTFATRANPSVSHRS